MMACLNALNDHSPCKSKSLPLPQNGHKDKSQTFSFDRVQKITVYISSCITWDSKLSGVLVVLVVETGTLRFKHNKSWGLSSLTAPVPPLRRKLLISSLFCSGPAVFAHRVGPAICTGWGSLMCAWRQRLEGNPSGTDDPKTYLPSVCWSSSLNNWKGFVFVTLFPFLCLQGICSAVSSTNQQRLRRILERDVLWLTISSSSPLSYCSLV